MNFMTTTPISTKFDPVISTVSTQLPVYWLGHEARRGLDELGTGFEIYELDIDLC